MADCGDQSPPLEVLVCFWIHHQQPGFISPFLDEGHHLCMPHALDVNAINLENTHTHTKERFLLFKRIMLLHVILFNFSIQAYDSFKLNFLIVSYTVNSTLYFGLNTC